MSRVKRLKVMTQLNDDVLEQVDMLLTAGEAKPVSINTHIYDQIKEHALQTRSDRATRPCIRTVQSLAPSYSRSAGAALLGKLRRSLPQPRVLRCQV